MTNKIEPLAKIFASKILRTNVKARPYPSLFYFPGLESKPFHDPYKLHFTKDFEENLGTIQDEYKSLRRAYGSNDDYEKVEGEKTLNQGGWHWMNYIAKGERRADS